MEEKYLIWSPEQGNSRVDLGRGRGVVKLKIAEAKLKQKHIFSFMISIFLFGNM
jgi:hypothetical protein